PERLIGKRVVGEINIPCGRCSICRLGLGKHCPNRSVLGINKRSGSFADYLSLPVKNLHVVPDGISDEEAAFTEPLAAACEVPARVKINASSKVAVLGDGRLAALTSQVIALKTNDITVIGLNPAKLSVIGSLGIRTHDVARKNRLKRMFDVVVECTGKPAGLPLASELVRPQGTVVLKSTYSGRLNWNPARLVIDEITIVGSRCGPFETALRLLSLGKVKVSPLLTSVYPFEHWQKAFRRARRSDSFKVLIRFT
ncbi:MAG: alcohol dehydrogenase catalytic domain-containing protein, partial [Candidatus Krumholzibacteria bacterium]|nr:alcohol dehydrogenase catalytic domain-containing protein [Candidatus Krumholzibacteria bacterium]